MDWSLLGQCHGVKCYSGSGTYHVLAPSAGLHRKGAWVELCSALPFDAYVEVWISKMSAAQIDVLFDIGIGAAGSERVLVGNLPASSVNDGSRIESHYLIPILVPAGTRISARSQCTYTTVLGPYLSMRAVGFGGFGDTVPLAKCTTIGADTSDTGGKEIDPGSVADTKGSWIEMSTSLTDGAKGFLIGIGNKLNVARTVYDWTLDIGIGAAGSEVAIIEDYRLSTKANVMTPRMSPLYPIAIPAGTRISARAQCSGTDSTDRLFDLILYFFI